MSKNSMLKNFTQRFDGWANLFTGRGNAKYDNTMSDKLVTEDTLTESDNRVLYRSGFGRRIVDRPASDMTREWFKISGDTDGAINKFLINNLDAKTKFKEAITWANVFGGSIIVMGIDDGTRVENPLEEPLNENNIQSVDFLRVYDRWRAVVSSEQYYNEPGHAKFGQPQFYRVTPLEPVSVESFLVHESRVLRFDGPLTDALIKSINGWWNDSIYQLVFRQLSNLDSAHRSVRSILDDFIQIILQIDNLQGMIAGGQEDLVKKRINILDMSRHVMNMVMLDSKENYSKESSSVAGLADLVQEISQAVSAVTGIPVTLLFGRSPAGMNSTGDADIRLYYDEIANRQQEKIVPQLNKLISIVMRATEGPTKGKEIEDWNTSPNPLWQPTEKEIAETKKITSETDEKYILNGVLDPNEVRDARFGGESYSSEIQVEGDLEPPEFPEPKETEGDE